MCTLILVGFALIIGGVGAITAGLKGLALVLLSVGFMLVVIGCGINEGKR